MESGVARSGEASARPAAYLGVPLTARMALWVRRVAPDALAVVLLAALPLLFLKEWPGRFLPPYGGDVFIHVYPLLSLLAHGLRQGRPVLWNFYAAGGYPLAPYSALSLFPPVAAALLALPVTAAIAALYAFYVAVLGVGAYVLAADLGLTRCARLVAAFTLAYSGFVAAHAYAGHVLELGAVCPMPLAFWLLRRAIMRASLRYAAWCGAAVGMMVLAAGVQFLPFALAPLPVLAVWHAVARARSLIFVSRPRARTSAIAGISPALAGVTTPAQEHPYRRLPNSSLLWVVWPLAALAIAGLVAAGLSAVAVGPFKELLGATLRAAPVPFADAAAQSLPWGGLAMFVAPGAFGSPANGTYWPGGRTSPYLHEIYAYAGLLPIVLLPLALLRRRAARPYFLLALAGLLVMLGANTPLYALLYRLPGGALFRVPARAGLVVDFALAMLVGFGVDALRPSGAFYGSWTGLVGRDGLRATNRGEGVGRPMVRRLGLRACLALGTLPGIVALAALGAGATGALGVPAGSRALALDAAMRLGLLLAAVMVVCAVAARFRRIILVLPLLAAVDLFSANGGLLRPADPAAYYSHMDAVRALPPGSTSRFLATDVAVPPGLSMITRRLYDTQDYAPLAETGYWRLSHPSLVAREGGDVATGRDRIQDVSPLFLRLFGVSTVLSASPLTVPGLRLAGRVTSVRWTAPGSLNWNVHPYQATSLVYRYDDPLPRAFVVSRALRVPDAATALGALSDGQVDPRDVALVSPASGNPEGLLGAAQGAWAGWLAASPDDSLTVAAGAPRSGGYLVVDDGWSPGWTATVDGHAVPVLRADDLLKAVQLPPGRHVVRLIYAPLSFLLGAVATLTTAALLALLALLTVVRRLRRRAIKGRAVY